MWLGLWQNLKAWTPRPLSGQLGPGQRGLFNPTSYWLPLTPSPTAAGPACCQALSSPHCFGSLLPTSFSASLPSRGVCSISTSRQLLAISFSRMFSPPKYGNDAFADLGRCPHTHPRLSALPTQPQLWTEAWAGPPGVSAPHSPGEGQLWGPSSSSITPGSGPRGLRAPGMPALLLVPLPAKMPDPPASSDMAALRSSPLCPLRRVGILLGCTCCCPKE